MKRSFPEHWVETELNNIIFDVINGDWGQETKTDKEIIKVKIIRGNEFSGRSISLAAERYIKEESYERRKLEEGDIVIEISGGSTNKPVGRVMYVSKKLICETTLPLICSNFYKRIRFSSQTNKNYIFQYLNYFWYIGGTETLQTQTTGLKNLVFNDYISIPIPLPPLNEQKRIAEKLDAILPKVKSARDRLEKIPAILKKFRQSVLAAACSGKLTEDWREGKLIIVEKVIKFKESIESMMNGIYKQEKYYSEKGIACLRMYNISDKGIIFKNLKRIILSEDEIRKFELLEGDIIINRVNSRELVGKSAVIEKKDLNEKLVFESKNIRIRINKNIANSKFINYCLINAKNNGFFWINSKQTAGMATISQPQILELDFNIPPLEEQQEIVRRVEKLFALADSIEEKYKKAHERLEKLEQAILAKAFRGELVEPDPNDEPAEELLKRILEEKAKLEREQKGKKRKK
ncbi:MAG: restriction endonuclease subunit S [Flavobacterium piscis]|nr:restriction endonuclease subunit S [Flavobacterium piscis]